MAALRDSQRVPQRCTECARRRVRCNKKSPCSTCIASRCAHLCTREIVRVRGKPIVATPINDSNGSLARENSRLHERIAELELALMMSLQDRAGLQASDVNRGDKAQSSSEQVTTFEEVGEILDDWNLGMLNRNHSEFSRSSNTDMEYYLKVLRILPTRQNSTQIVDFSLRTLGWVHCAVRTDDFLATHNIFQDALESGTMQVLQDHEWMAIYFSILAVGLFYMKQGDIIALKLKDVDGRSDPLHVCHVWYNSAFNQLELSDGLGKPRIHVIQVAAILTLCNSHFGEGYREMNLFNIAINAARSLKMHRLGTESSFPSGIQIIPEWSTQANRELGRRLWWTIVICDWLAGLRRLSFITPESFDCTLTIGDFDHNIITGGAPVSDGVSMFSPLLHHVELAKLARHVYNYLQLRKKSPSTLCQFLQQLDTSEQNFIAKIDCLSASFVDGINRAQCEPEWVAGQRAHYLCTINYMRLTFCRVLLEPRLSQLEIWSEIHTHAMTAAFNIVHIANVPLVYRMMWVFGSATIAAGVFLCLDLLIPNKSRTAMQAQQQRDSVNHCINSLSPYGYKTTICKEGPKALARLLELEIAQKTHPAQHKNIMQTILSIAQTPQHNLTLGSVEEQSPGSWLPLAGSAHDMTYDGLGFPANMSNVLPGIMNLDESSNIDWVLDTTMLFNMS